MREVPDGFPLPAAKPLKARGKKFFIRARPVHKQSQRRKKSCSAKSPVEKK
jgi:hypothetical protein